MKFFKTTKNFVKRIKRRMFLNKVKQNLLNLIRAVKRKPKYGWKNFEKDFNKLKITLPLKSTKTKNPFNEEMKTFQLRDKDFIHK